MSGLEFERELEKLINRCSIENESNTPDYILAGYIGDCLTAFNRAVKERARWCDRNAERIKAVLEAASAHIDAEESVATGLQADTVKTLCKLGSAVRALEGENK